MQISGSQESTSEMVEGRPFTGTQLKSPLVWFTYSLEECLFSACFTNQCGERRLQNRWDLRAVTTERNVWALLSPTLKPTLVSIWKFSIWILRNYYFLGMKMI